MTRANKEPLVISDVEAAVIYRKLRIGQFTFLACYISLLLLFSLLNIIEPEGGFKLWLVQCIPLLIFIPGLVQQRFRTYSWACFVILLYFTWSVVNAMSPLVRWHDLFVVAVSVIMFIAAMMTSRWLQYWQYYQQQNTTETHS